MQMTCKQLKESDKNNELVVSEQTEWSRATAWASSLLRAEKVFSFHGRIWDVATSMKYYIRTSYEKKGRFASSEEN